MYLWFWNPGSLLVPRSILRIWDHRAAATKKKGSRTRETLSVESPYPNPNLNLKKCKTTTALPVTPLETPLSLPPEVNQAITMVTRIPSSSSLQSHNLPFFLRPSSASPLSLLSGFLQSTAQNAPKKGHFGFTCQSSSDGDEVRFFYWSELYLTWQNFMTFFLLWFVGCFYFDVIDFRIICWTLQFQLGMDFLSVEVGFIYLWNFSVSKGKRYLAVFSMMKVVLFVSDREVFRWAKPRRWMVQEREDCKSCALPFTLTANFMFIIYFHVT